MRTNINTTPFTPRDTAAYEYGLESGAIRARTLGDGCLKSSQGAPIRATISDDTLRLDGPAGWHAQRPHQDPEPLACWLHRALTDQAEDARRWAIGCIRNRAESTPGWEATTVGLLGPDIHDPALRTEGDELIAVTLDVRTNELVVGHQQAGRMASIWAAWTADEPLDDWLAARMGPHAGDDEDEEAAA